MVSVRVIKMARKTVVQPFVERSHQRVEQIGRYPGHKEGNEYTAQGINHAEYAHDNDQRNDAADKAVEGNRRLSAYSEVVHRSVFVDKSVRRTGGEAWQKVIQSSGSHGKSIYSI